MMKRIFAVKAAFYKLGALAVLLAAFLLGCAQPEVVETTLPPETSPIRDAQTGYVAALTPEVSYYDAEGNALGKLLRGTQVEYGTTAEGKTGMLLDGQLCFLEDTAQLVAEPEAVIPQHTLYVRTTVNLRDVDGRLLETLAEKGSALEVIGFDYLNEETQPHMYRVRLGEQEGYIMPWYVTDTQEAAIANYDNGSYAIHADREDHYGGGYGANLDYFPREKGPIEGNPMPQQCRTLYLVSWQISSVDAYIALAKDTGVNAFVVDITDGDVIGYAGPVMESYSPFGAAAAKNTLEEYQLAIRKLKEAGFYVIGRITTFNDTYFVKDHPEYAITNTGGEPLKLSGDYWPTAFNRTAWQYKVDMAVEAVELMGFHEIQFDYVRFPDSTGKYERAGTIDFRNTYGETKAQAIQRFLMYATDILHEHGAYVSADVYGESAYTYVTGYGQYWPAISNVVDVISGMPYPDHFSANGDWLPWEHPYDTLYNWGQYVMDRQAETATPAAVRTWIQAYNAIREPYNSYGAFEVSEQIRGLQEAGCTGGYMTWNPSSSIEKYATIIPAFAVTP